MKRSNSEITSSYEDIEDKHKNSNNDHLVNLAVQLRDLLGDEMGDIWTLDGEELRTTIDMAEEGFTTLVSEMTPETHKLVKKENG